MITALGRCGVLTLAPSLSPNSRCSLLVPRSIPGYTCTRAKQTKPDPREDLPKTGRSAAQQKDFGKIYDKKPFKFMCEKGKSYMWCTCGWSHTQPFCDSTHKNQLYKITLRPVRFIAPETKEYYFCNCKQTLKRPFCDGTHKRQDIQDKIKS